MTLLFDSHPIYITLHISYTQKTGVGSLEYLSNMRYCKHIKLLFYSGNLCSLTSFWVRGKLYFWNYNLQLTNKSSHLLAAASEEARRALGEKVGRPIVRIGDKMFSPEPNHQLNIIIIAVALVVFLVLLLIVVGCVIKRWGMTEIDRCYRQR